MHRSRAAFRGTGPRRRGLAAAAAHRDDARSRPAARRRGHHRARSRIARRARRRNVAVVVLDNARRRMAGVGGIGRLLRRRLTAARSTASRPPAAGSALKPFTYALGVRAGLHAGDVLADVPSHFPTAEARQFSTARATTTASFAARCSRARARRFGKRARCGARVRSRRRRPAPRSCDEPVHDVRHERRLLRRSASPSATPKCASTSLSPRYAMFARGGCCGPTATDRDRRPTRVAGGSVVSAAHRLLDHRHPLPTRRARVHLRPRRQPGIPVPRRGEDGHIAGVSRQLDHRLYARRHRRRLGRQLRPEPCVTPPASPARSDLPRRDAGGRPADGRDRPGG